MRGCFIPLVLCFPVLLCAGELPWVGVSLKSADDEQRAAVDLGPGVGFLVERVVGGSPLDQAGGKEGDLWWKFGDQILINKSQMVVLLRSYEPGQAIEVTFFRSGVRQVLKLKPGEQPRQQIYPVRAGPDSRKTARVLTKREKVARLSTEDHDLLLRREGKGWRFEVTKNGVSILSALVLGDELEDKIPNRWHQSFSILKVSLGDQEGRTADRVRYVPREKNSPRK